MTGRYQRLEHTADVMVRCTGADLEECFENAAYAMFDQIVDAERINDVTERTIEVTQKDDCDRLYAFLSELLFVMDCEGIVFNDFHVEFDDDTVRCIARGEPLDVKRHHARAEIKAVTYHMMDVDRSEPSVTVIFDV